MERHDKLFHSLLDVFVLYFESIAIQSTKVDNHDDHHATNRVNDLGLLHNHARTRRPIVLKNQRVDLGHGDK